MAQDPTEARDLDDPGDDTQMRFRYQHAYGVTILAMAAAGKLEYTAVWCEQQEDLLAETPDSQYDAIQVKTRNEGDGYWQVGSTTIKSAIHRFAKLQDQFRDKIRRFAFVSNMAVESRRSKEEHSPKLLLDSVSGVDSPADLTGDAKKAFDKLLRNCPTNESGLFDTLRKTQFQLGPPKEAFETVLSHDTLPLLPELKDASRPQLDSVRDDLIARVYEASSLSGSDGSEYWSALAGDLEAEQTLRRKRISVESFHLLIRSSLEAPFRYLPLESDFGLQPDSMSLLGTKLQDGDLFHQFGSLKAKALATESRFHEMALSDPERFQKQCSQIMTVVHGECSEAYLHARDLDTPFGDKMMRDLLARLTKVAEATPEKVHREPVETLIGAAGLLTAQCSVGWSESYPMGTIE